MINDLFASLYESICDIYNVNYPDIFSSLYDNGSYVLLAVILLFLPLIFWLLFYYLWRYPYGKLWHWLVWLSLITLIVFGSTYGTAKIELISFIGDPNYEPYVSSLPVKYAMANSILSIVIGIVYSLILKQWSRIQTHLPF